jgi:hypothetical protein
VMGARRRASAPYRRVRHAHLLVRFLSTQGGVSPNCRAQDGLRAVALAEQPGVRIGRRGMIVDGPPLAMEARLALRLPPDG